MRTHSPFRSTLAASLLAASAAFAGPMAPGQQQQQMAVHATPHVDLVIALDTSSSMDGLIDGAREKLWDVVNLLNQAKPRPLLRVGLVSYGNDGYAPATGWVRKESELSGDLDQVYSKLFALRTNGGQEYVARAMTEAVDHMQWDQDPQSLKILFVAGNEPANQDPLIPVERATNQARERGIIVNTIYCGSESAGEARLWRDVALRGAGRYAAIDQNRAVAIATPMDAELDRLSRELNGTYIGYGPSGMVKAQNQAVQDGNASGKSSSAAAGRAIAKSGELYRADDWDLVDAKKKGNKDIGHMKPADLPPAIAAMPPAQREAFVEEKAKERDAIKKKIAEVGGKREQFLRAERAKRPTKGGIDEALGDAIQGEAQTKGFKF